MRFSEDSPQDLARARSAVKEWRERNLLGTAEQLIADIGSQFHPDYGTVLRGILFAVDSHGAKIITGVSIVAPR